MNETKAISVTIANGASESASIPLLGSGIVTIYMPATWTTANLTFLGKNPVTGNFLSVTDENGVERTVTAAASKCIKIPADWLHGIDYLKIRSGTAGTPVNQGGDRILSITRRAFA